MTSRPRLGIIGAGQLARMTAQAASRLGVHTTVLVASPRDPAAEVASRAVVGSDSSLSDLEALARECDVITFDHEMVDPGLVDELRSRGHVVRPGAHTLRFSNKAHQRETFDTLGVPVPRYRVVHGLDGVTGFAGEVGWPVVVKPDGGGYDGRGVHIVRSAAQAAELFTGSLVGSRLVVEELLPLTVELSVVVARRPGGESVVYPVVETVQTDGICTELVAPASVDRDLARRATALALRVAELVQAVGIVAVELFVSGDRLFVNEIAPRPHNSGHHTIDGSITSQFENHVRAVLDWPLGDTSLTAPAVAMVNVLGSGDGVDPQTRVAAALAIPGVRIHLYGKQARPGRKLGHITATGDDHASALGLARTAAAVLTGSSHSKVPMPRRRSDVHEPIPQPARLGGDGQ